MATSHFRHQLHLHGAQVKRLALVGTLLLLLPSLAMAQRKAKSRANRGKNGTLKSITVQNLPSYDERWFHPGMFVALTNSRFNVEQSAQYVARQNVSANAINSPSLGVGFIGDARIGGPHSPFIFRFAPGVSFLTRKVEFKPRGYQTDTVYTQEVTATVVQFPLLLKYQSDRRRNARMYMIAGISPSVTASSRRSDPLRNQLRAVSSDLTLEYGVGLDLFYPLFKLAPELRFSHGLKNLLTPHNDFYSNSLQSLSTNSVTLYINIQN
ncbi:porin family protein [Hymenobacter monticola]|uniref:PorT family protein n=1 Tax=Hymenobacter monticola TaxID=1705399 RepID=A0ABY4B9M5_9BACT|nr:porin family protein [Hymenobacter monticola]UOE33340.1 PorT family protein [Hymenobacter monticola]